MEELTRKIKVSDYVQVINQTSKPRSWHHKLVKCIASRQIGLEAFRNIKFCTLGELANGYLLKSGHPSDRCVYMLFKHRGHSYISLFLTVAKYTVDFILLVKNLLVLKVENTHRKLIFSQYALSK